MTCDHFRYMHSYRRVRFMDAFGVIYYEWVTVQECRRCPGTQVIVCRTPEAQ